MAIHSERKMEGRKGWEVLGGWGCSFTQGIEEGHTDQMAFGTRRRC